MLVTGWDINKNFWITNPKFLTVKTFKDFYDGDKSKDKKESSDKMWGTALIVDYDSIYISMRYEDRIEFLTPQYGIQDDQLCDAYNYLQKDSEKRHMDIWSKKLDQLSTLLDSTVLDVSNAEDITKLMLQLDKLLELKDKIERRASKADNAINRGGGKSSLMEDGLI